MGCKHCLWSGGHKINMYIREGYRTGISLQVTKGAVSLDFWHSDLVFPCMLISLLHEPEHGFSPLFLFSLGFSKLDSHILEGHKVHWALLDTCKLNFTLLKISAYKLAFKVNYRLILDSLTTLIKAKMFSICTWHSCALLYYKGHP